VLVVIGIQRGGRHHDIVYPPYVPPPTYYQANPGNPPAPTTNAVESPENAAIRLTSALRKNMARVAPNVQTINGVAGSGPVTEPLGAFPSQGGFKAFADLRDDRGPSTFFIDMSWTQASAVAALTPEDLCAHAADEGVSCTVRRGARQEFIVVKSGTRPGGTTQYQVNVVKTDGTNLYATVGNYSANDQPSSKTGSPYPQRDVPLLTTEQLVDLLTSPDLFVSPTG
jgi:hypothetical protein